jgi:hypothetical protein
VSIPTDDVYDGNGGSALFLKRHNVVSVETVTIDEVEIPESESVTESGWILDGSTLRLRGYVFTRGIQNVVVTTAWGYQTIPAIASNACLTLTVNRLKEITKHPGITWEQIGDRQYRYVVDAMPQSLLAMLDTLRRRTSV